MPWSSSMARGFSRRRNTLDRTTRMRRQAGALSSFITHSAVNVHACAGPGRRYRLEASMIRIFPKFLHARAVALVFVIGACLPSLAIAQVATGSIVGVRRRFEQPDRARRAGHDPQRRTEHVDVSRDRRQRRLFGAVSRAGHIRSPGGVTGIQDLAAQRPRAAGQRSAAYRRGARSGRTRRDHHGPGERAGRAQRFVRSRHGDRGDGDQGTAAQRPQLRDAGLPRAGYHAGAGEREPLRRAARSTRAARRISTRSDIRRIRTAGSSTASTTASSRSTP